MNKLSWLLAGIALATAAFVLVLASPGAKAWQSGDIYGGSGDWTINNPTIVADESSLTVSGNLVINAKLEVYNSYLTMNSASDNQYSVNVTSTGTLQMYGSTLTAYNTAYHYSFLVWGSLDINQSNVAEMWGDTTATTPWVGGIQIYKSGAQIRNSNIFNGRTGGIYINNCSATVTGCNIYSNGGSGSTSYCYGIYMTGDGMGTATATKIDGNYIFGNTFVSGTTRYGYGIYSMFQGSDDKITNNRIYDNGFTMNMGSQGTQLRLQYSNATVTDNFLGNGTYQLYVYGSSPPAMKNMNFSAYAYSSYTTYGVYADNSTLTFDTCSWYSFWGMGTEYGVYSTGPTVRSAAFLTFKGCSFNFTQTGTYTRYFIYGSRTYLDIGGSTFTGTNGTTFYGVYSTASSTYRGSTNITNSVFNITNSTSTTYMLYNSYCPLNISGSTFDLYMAGYSGGTVYMLYATSYSNVTILSSRFTLTRPQFLVNNTHYMFYLNSYSPLIVEDSQIEFSVRVGPSSANLIYASSYCPMSFNRTSVRAHNITAGSFYGIYTSNTGGNIIFNNSNFQLIDIGYFTTSSGSYISSYMNNIYYADLMFLNKSTFYILNCTNASAMYQLQLIAVYLQYGNVSIDKSDMRIENAFLPTDTGKYRYLYGIYLYNYGIVNKGCFITNSTVRMPNNRGENSVGYSFMLYYNERVYFSNSTFNITSSGQQDIAFYAMGYSATQRMRFVIENCTIEYSTLVPRGNDVYTYNFLFYYLYYTDIFVNDTNILMQNLGGPNPYGFSYYSYLARWEFLNTNVTLIYGNGNGSSPRLTVIPFQFTYQMDYMNFTNSMFKVTLKNDPIKFTFMEFYYYQTNLMSFRNSKMIWEASAPDSVMSMFGVYSGGGGSPSLKTLRLFDGSSIETVINADNCDVKMIEIKSGGQLEQLSVQDSTFKITVNRATTQANAALYIDTAKDLTLKGLTFEVNGPPLSVDPGRTTTVAGVKLVRSSVTLEGVTVKSNGLGRSAGIWCDLGSSPDIINSTFSESYIGILSTLYSQPALINCTISGCPRGIMLDLSGNATLVNTRIDSGALAGVTGALLTDESWINIIDSVISTETDLDLDGASSAWLLNATVSRPSVKLRDQKSTLIVNWRQELWVTWQNDVPIPGAQVLMHSALGSEFMRAATDQDGIVPPFIVTEYVETASAKTMHSPYKVNVSYGGFSGEDSVVTSKSQRTQIKVWDTILPVLAVVTPEDGRFQNYRAVLLTGTASDMGSGIGRLRFSHDGQTWTEMPASGAWALVMDVPEGAFTLTVVLTDIAGNEVSHTVRVNIDLTAPFIIVDSPGADSLGNVIGVDLRGRLEPGSTLAVNQRAVEVAPDGSFVYSVRLVEGPNSFAFFATDRAGNTNTSGWRLFLDITPPPLALSSPADGLLTNLTAVQVTGRTEPGATATLNGANIEVGPDGSFSARLELRQGANSIAVVASDPAGNRATQLRTVLMDNEIRLTVRFPTDNMATNLVTILVQGETDTDVVLRLNDGLVTVAADGNFSVTFTLDEGLNVLAFSARDRAGNGLDLTRRVVLDITPPSLELLSPQDGALLKSREVTVTGACEPGMTLAVNGETVATDTGSFSKTLTLPEGRSLIAIEGRDAAGNAVSAQLSVLVDMTAPSLEIVEPATGFRTRDYSVVVVGLTEPGATVRINGQPVMVDPFGKFTSSVTLRKGKNDIRVVASDGAGNSAQKSIAVTGTSAPAAPAESNWLWTAVGLVVALGVMLPLTALLVTVAVKGGRAKEGSK